MPLLHIMGRLVERDLPAFGSALQAVQPQVAHPTAACSGFLRRLADAGRIPDLYLARTQLVTERAALRAMIEQGYGHLIGVPGENRIYTRYTDRVPAGRRLTMLQAEGGERRGPLGQDRPPL